MNLTSLNITSAEQGIHTWLLGQALTSLVTPTNLIIFAAVILVIGGLIRTLAVPVSSIFILIGAGILIYSIFMILG